MDLAHSATYRRTNSLSHAFPPKAGKFLTPIPNCEIGDKNLGLVMLLLSSVLLDGESNMKDREYFSLSEAQSKLGKHIRTLVSFADVPAGTHGRVAKYYKACEWTSKKPVFGLDIAWTRFLGDTLTDGFSKGEYLQFLEEL